MSSSPCSKANTRTAAPRRARWSALQRACRVAGCALALVGCGAAAQPAPAVAPAAHGPPLEFAFSGAGEQVSSGSLRGRPTVVLFLTTYDLASQFAARDLAQIVRSFTPRANAVAVVFEDAQYEELLPLYRQTLELPYPVVMGDIATRAGQSAFGPVDVLPTLVVLDRSGREVWRHAGAAARAEVIGALERAASSGP
jgi:hypothetical protein